MLGMNATAGARGIPSADDNIVALFLLSEDVRADIRGFTSPCYGRIFPPERHSKGTKPTDRLTDSVAPLFTDVLHCAALDHN